MAAMENHGISRDTHQGHKKDQRHDFIPRVNARPDGLGGKHRDRALKQPPIQMAAAAQPIDGNNGRQQAQALLDGNGPLPVQIHGGVTECNEVPSRRQARHHNVHLVDTREPRRESGKQHQSRNVPNP